MASRGFVKAEKFHVINTMGWTGELYWLLTRRLRTSWGLLAITSFGILTAVTLMAVGAVYSRALAEGGIRHTLATKDPATLDTRVIVQQRPLGPADYRKLRRDIEDIAEQRLGYLVRDIQRFGRAQPNWPLATSSDAPLPPGDPTLGRPFFLTGYQEHSQLVEGRWPEVAPVLDTKGLHMEAVVGAGSADFLGLEPGSQVSLFPYRSDPSERIVLTLVGLAEAIDPGEEFWLNDPRYFRLQEVGGQSLMPIYVRERDFFDGIGTQYPTLVGDFGWFLYADTGAVTASNAGPTKHAVIGLETDINKRFPRSQVITGLDTAVAEYQRELTLAKVPLYLFLGLVVLLIIYFLALIIGLLSRFRAEEAGLLRSRGGSVLQVTSLLVAIEGVVVLVSMVAGPFLALAIVRFLLLKTLDPVGVGEGGLSVGLSGDMFVMGAVGGLLSLAVLVAFGVSRARMGMVGSLQQRARPPSVSILHRYYVDLLVLVLLGLLWWQTSSRDGFISRDVASRAVDVDPSLLFGPVLALLAAAFLVLRFLPLVVRLLAWTMSRVSPPWMAFTLVRLARYPLPHGALLIILMMAAALGVFGASFQSTLARSQKEQALYSIGGDLVLRGTRLPLADQQAATTTPGVQTVSPLSRDTVTLLDGLPGTDATLVGFDADTISEVSWFRNDFSGKSLSDLLRPLRANRLAQADPSRDTTPGIAIPSNGERIGLWVKVDELRQGLAREKSNLWARIRDGEGRYHSLLLGELSNPNVASAGADNDPGSEGREEAPEQVSPSNLQPGALPSSPVVRPGWIYLEARLPQDGATTSRPLALVSVFISKKSIGALSPGSISLDNVTIKGSGIPSAGVVIEDFEMPGEWEPIPQRTDETDTVDYTPEGVRPGSAGLRFSWPEPLAVDPKGLFLPPSPYPLPAIGSGSFHTGQILRFRDGKQVLPVVIRDVTDFFPTLDPASTPFLLVDRQDYRQLLQHLPQGNFKPPQELWLSIRQGADREEVKLALRNQLSGFISIRDRMVMVDVARRNPLAGGGWNGLTILAISAIAVAVVLTLAVHGAVVVHYGRVDLTVARTLGFSRSQIFLSLALERLLVAALGIGAGSVIGVWLGRWVLGFLDITPRGKLVIPPMVVDFEVWLIGLVLAALAAATLGSIILTDFWVRKLRVSRCATAGRVGSIYPGTGCRWLRLAYVLAVRRTISNWRLEMAAF